MVETKSLKVPVYRKGAPEEPIAQVELNAAGMLSIISANDAGRADVEAFIQRANAKPTISMNVPPPDDAERYQLHSRAVERGEADFFQALRGYASIYFDLLLGGDETEDAELAELRAKSKQQPPSEFAIDLHAPTE